MRWEQPEARPGRTAVFLLVAAILVATALAIALVVGRASQSSLSSDHDLVLSGSVTPVSPDSPEDETVAGPVVVARAPALLAWASIVGVGDLVISRTSKHVGPVLRPHR